MYTKNKDVIIMEKVHLSNSEWEIMNVLWEFSCVTISQIVTKLNEKKFWDKHTVITLLNRMEKKGAVAYRRNERAKEYYSIISQNDTVMQESEQFLNRVFAGSLSLMVNTFLDNEKIKKEEIDELYKIIKKIDWEDME